ncbi:MAG: hypothetical protein HOA61_01915 [Bacteroidetes bacterium]|jgi:hypothetical protein|nr:hypothetical protein [Chloroflexota bacterium]MBT6834776.1 hypothetical protein [Bacteroidota bacterium]MBT4002501.1 hypothetical protein [Chloroflexota bacterium]MBT4306212.1 hypothetical protein [Chloroflexota bacterium]MBT4534999.1 hypothetical protein [Chloroflexota bacterium]
MNSDKNIKPILITGAHRSGTTWIGKIISSSKTVSYIHEPFNINNQFGIYHHKFDYWFTYVNSIEENQVARAIQNTLSFNYNYLSAMKNFRIIPFANPLSITKEFIGYKYAKTFNQRPLMKDPLAIFSAEWLYKIFNMDVLITIRHPAAFVASLKTKNWVHDFNHFLQQPELIEDLLIDYVNEITDFAEDQYDIVEQASLLWKIIYSVVYKYYLMYKNEWIFIRHEDLSRDPISEYKLLFQKLDINFTDNIISTINKHSQVNNQMNRKFIKKSHISRNSKNNILKWKNELTKSEIQRIRDIVNPISKLFYSDSEW